MHFLIGISHPKQVHMFKHVIAELEKKGHRCCVVVNEKECTGKLLAAAGIDHIRIGVNQKGVLRKSVQLGGLLIKTLWISLKFKPDLVFGQVVPHIGYTAFLLGKPFIVFEDTEVSGILHRLVHPFAHAIVTPDSFKKQLGRRQITIQGGFELAYLHANRFTPDIRIREDLGLLPDERFVILRFVAWHALHDMGRNMPRGLTVENKIRAVQAFETYARVFISSEGPLPDELVSRRYPLPPESMLHAMHYADLVFGESASMAAEAACLGTPAIYLDNVGRGYTDDLEKRFGLVFNFTESPDDQGRAIDKGCDILAQNDPGFRQARHRDLMHHAMDVTAFATWFIENFPDSRRVMQQDPGFQDRFNE
jgi:predicted glycosyltransferase